MFSLPYYNHCHYQIINTCSFHSTELQCYIHAVSPTKQSGPTKYFNCNLQTQTNVVKAVCFAIDKRDKHDAFAQQHSPVKIKKYNLSKKYGREDVVIDKTTVLTPSTTTAFAYKCLDNITSISSLSQVAPEQLVAIKGHLSQLSGVKTLVLQSNPVKKQEAYISDPTGYIKLVVWGDHAGTLEEGKTYYFDKVRVKLSHQERYINTPKNEECKISLVDAFSDPVKTVDIVSPVKDLTGNITGVTNINKFYCCCFCNKKVTVNGKLATCNNCGMKMKLTRCNLQWSLKLYVQESSKPDNKLRLSVFNDVFIRLMDICSVDTSSTSDDEIIEKILDLELVKLSFDSQNNKLINIQVIHI